ncbi:hypothetical protein [Mucilaginibacter gilvus]|uniref:Uncharacterized protein n=1 Tax=Mucilaginibacter gilvus TaxID=2305909 RepID=A0A3S3VK66_9SPHI|nr:hypothetical protein [Mucilaginibacter gilvus]RWY50114.1 hypothetical protein EPL05_15260 [Mucilaginibacter gilvus]
MKRLFNRLPLAALLLFSTCSNPKQKPTHAIGTSFLADSNFRFINKDLNTDCIHLYSRKNKSEEIHNWYADSLHKQPYTDLTEDQRGILLGSSFPAKGYGAEFARNAIQACFVAKQEKIGTLQPIIVYWEHKGEGWLEMLLLDKNGKPINHIVISGCYEDDKDYHITTCNRSTLSKNQVITYQVTKKPIADTLKEPMEVDSVITKYTMLPSGKMYTQVWERKSGVRKKLVISQ